MLDRGGFLHLFCQRRVLPRRGGSNIVLGLFLKLRIVLRLSLVWGLGLLKLLLDLLLFRWRSNGLANDTFRANAKWIGSSMLLQALELFKLLVSCRLVLLETVSSIMLCLLLVKTSAIVKHCGNATLLVGLREWLANATKVALG